MDWKTIVPKPISEAIRRFRLPRAVMVKLVSRLHHDIPRDYPRFRNFRVDGAEDNYRYRIGIREDSVRYLFTFAVDDTTAQGFLIVADITCHVR